MATEDEAWVVVTNPDGGVQAVYIAKTEDRAQAEQETLNTCLADGYTAILCVRADSTFIE